jgi:hypothetical protein
VTTFYWVGGTGTLNNTGTTHIAATSGGSSGAGPCTSADSIVIDSASGGGTITVAASTFVDFTISGGTQTLAGSGALAINGSLSLPASGTTVTYTGTITFGATATGKTITTNGVSLSSAITFNGVGGGWALAGALTTTGAMTLTNGALDLAGFTFTCSTVISSNSNTRSIAFGSGKIVCTTTAAGAGWGCGTNTNLTISGTPLVEFTGNASVNSRTFNNGGTAGASAANAISLNVTAGSEAALAVAGSIQNLNFTGFSGTYTTATARTMYGNLTVSAGMTWSAAGTLTFGATSGTQQITTNGVTIDGPLTVNGVGGTVQLQDNLTMGSTRNLTLTNGTLDLNGKAVSCQTFSSNNSNVRTLAFGAGSITVNTNFTATTATNLTVTKSAGAKISMSSASAKTFNGGGASWPKLENSGTGSLVIGGASNTFADITTTVLPATFTFPNGNTQTFTAFSLSGDASNQCTINSDSAGVAATISKASGTVAPTYMTITDSTATGGATWDATGTGNVNGGGNTGWTFATASGGNFFAVL